MDQRNLLLAVVLSVGILVAFEAFFGGLTPSAPQPQETSQQAVTGEGAPSVPTTGESAGGAPSPGDPLVPGLQGAAGQAAPSATVNRDQALDVAPRVEIQTPTVKGSISLVGGRVDDLTLLEYHATVDKSSPFIELLHPRGSSNAYYATFGWSAQGTVPPLPRADTIWTADGDRLTPGHPVTLTWDNGEGLVFERRFEIDEHYLFTVTQRVVNQGESAVVLAPYGLISRTGTPPTLGFYILHEGLIGVFDGTLKEVDYDDLQDDGTIAQATTGGWLGITDKYWLVALAPDQTKPVNTRFVHALREGRDVYQTDLLYDAATVAPGAAMETVSRVFAGAKEVILLDDYEEVYGIQRFDLAVDFGWFYFLTKPFFYCLHYIAGLVGNFGVAILIFTVLVKLVFFPLANKSYKSMAKMRKLQPEMLKLRERFADDKQKLQQEMMALYKKEGANPISGCLPIVIQIPVFFALYKVLFVSIEMRHAPFFGWIQDLSAPDPTTILNGFGLFPWPAPELGLFNLLNIGVWPLLMGLSMWFQQRLNPQPPDPMQARIFAMLPIVFTFLLASFPAGLVIYWTWNNTLSMLQQMVIMKRQGVPIGRQPKTKTT